MAPLPTSPNSLPSTAPPSSIKPVCPFFYECGGCDTQDVAYADQVAFKDGWLRLLFQPLTDGPWLPLVRSPEEYPLYFRNKIRYGFVEYKGRIWPSRHAKGETSADIPVDVCFLQSEESVAVMNFTAAFAERHTWNLYNPLTGKGWLKHLLVRQSKASGKMLVSLVTDDAPIPAQAEWVKEVREAFPFVSSLWHTVSWGRSNEKLEDTLLWGEHHLLEQVGECRFYISPQAFFQTNGSMVQTLYDQIAQAAALTGKETVWDLYAGSATIGLYLHTQAKRVVCIERNAANIADAERNIVENAASNVTMIGNSVEAAMTSAFITEYGPADVIIVDPPRAGLADSLKRILPNLPPHRLVYVSCNPVTCLRDLKELSSRGYKIVSLQGLDLFPHTLHCEMITVLQLEG